jgi:hypothetical protein
MADQLFVEDLIQRIRGLIRADAKSVTPAGNTAEQILVRLSRRIPFAADGPTSMPELPVVYEMPELNAIKADLQACVSASAMVGEMNQRHPGFVNDRIQSVKRLMRRSLGWYTRPFHLFHGALIGALQHLTDVVEKQGRALDERVRRDELLETNQRIKDVEIATRHLHELTTSAIDTKVADLESIKGELAGLREDVFQLRTDLTTARQQLARKKDRIARDQEGEPRKP